MNNHRMNSFFRSSRIIGVCIFLFACVQKQTGNSQLPEPKIRCGTAKLSGKIINPSSKVSSLVLRYQNPVTAEESLFETNIENNGSFYFEVPVECSVVIGSLVVPEHGGSLVVLSSERETKVELRIGTEDVKIVKVEGGFPLLTEEDEKSYGNIFEKYLTYRYESKPVHRMTLQEYVQHELGIMKVRTEYALKGEKITDAGRNLALNECHLLHLSGRLLGYKEAMDLSYRNFKEKENSDDYTPGDPDLNYYSFLKSFELNNPQYLYNQCYTRTIQRLLSAKALNIPPISDTPIDSWLNGVKTTLSELVGFNKGQFFDMLAANAYAKQFIEESAPLSDKQKENIGAYFGHNEIAKILLRKNEDIIKLAAEQNTSVINETPSVPKEELADAIVSKYKGKVVVIDFWATWCGPCLNAMKQIHSVKNILKNKPVVFVYLTNESSPEKLWNQKIKSIPGEHYYLNSEQWEYLMDKFNFEYIPSYLIYSKKGTLNHQFTAYPGTGKLQEVIESELK